MTPRLLIAALLMLLALPLRAQTLDKGLPLDGPGEFPFAAARDLAPPMGECDAFAVYNGNLLGARLGSAPLRLHRVELNADFAANPISEIAIPALPDGFTPQAMTANPFTQHLVVAGKVGDAIQVWKSSFDAKLELGPWEVMPPIAVPDAVRVRELMVMGEYVLVLDEWSREGDLSPGGWAANLGQAEELFRWIEIPRPSGARRDYCVLVGKGMLMSAGGRIGAGDNALPNYTTEGVPFDQTTFGAWTDQYIPVTPRLSSSVGTSFGASTFLAQRRPLPLQSGDLPTSMTVFSQLERPDGSRTLWLEYYLSQPPAEVRALLVDPGNSRILVIAPTGREGTLRVAGYNLPKFFPAQVVTEKEQTLRFYEKAAAQPARRSVQETLARARDSGRLALLVITSGDREEDVNLRFNMRTSRYRQMTMNAESTYLDGEAGRAALAEYGVRGTPALLLVDPQGTVVKQHTGSIPSIRELFELTTPTRQSAAN